MRKLEENEDKFRHSAIFFFVFSTSSSAAAEFCTEMEPEKGKLKLIDIGDGHVECH